MTETPESRKVISLSGQALNSPFGPVHCGMPDLSDLRQTMLDYVLNSLLRGAGSRDSLASAYLRGYILVTDKAIVEYEAARASLQEFVTTRTKLSVFIQTTWHLGNCLHSSRRALRFVDRLRGVLGAVMPRIDWRAIATHEQLIREIRDIIEHMDDKIAADQISADGYLIALTVNNDGEGASIGTSAISFDRLATLLVRLNALALLLADYHEPNFKTVLRELP